VICDSLEYMSGDLTDIVLSLNNVSFEYASKEVDGEKTFAYVYRVKKRGEGWCDSFVKKTLHRPDFINHLKKLTGKEKIEIDRCQIHKYPVGGSILKHTDTDTQEEYTHTILVGLSDLYEGGVFRVYHKDGIQTKQALKDDLVICPSDIPHDLTKIDSGERIVIVFFLT
jgi:hypothetical protein